MSHVSSLRPDAPRAAEVPKTPEPPPDAAGAAAPLVTIRPSRSWVPLNLRDLWAYRELLFFLTWRDVKVRYRQTLLGAAWAVAQPLGTALVFTVFLAPLVRFPADGLPYALFAYAGLVPWVFFANTVLSAGNSLVFNADLITKVYFPRLIIPAAAIGLGLVDLAVALVVLGGLMLWYGVAVTAQLALVPLLIVLTALLALGAGLALAALNVKYRDVRHAMPFLIQLGMFASPVFYPADAVPERWRWLLALNPMTGIIEGYRSALFGLPVDWAALGLAAGVTLALLAGAAYVFRHMEKTFADLV